MTATARRNYDAPGGRRSSRGTGTVPIGFVVFVGLVTAGGLFGAYSMLHGYAAFPFDLVDFDAYRAAAHALLHGHSVYAGIAHGPVGDTPPPFVYPPFAAVVFAPFSLLSKRVGEATWTLLTIGLMAMVVRSAFTSSVAKFASTARGRSVAWMGVGLVVVSLSPVQEHLRYGQIGVLLMAGCIADCVAVNPRWPRGVLIGVATGLKLVPGLFIVYLLLTRRVRAGAIALLTFVGSAIAGFAIAPSDSRTYWGGRLFKTPSGEYFTNQSLAGMLRRAMPDGPWQLWWVAASMCVAAATVVALRTTLGSASELVRASVVGVAGAVISPISWIHHLVWIIPLLGGLSLSSIGQRPVDRARSDSDCAGNDPRGATSSRRETRTWLVIGATILTFVVRIPFIADAHLHGVVRTLAVDADGVVLLGLLALVLVGAVALNDGTSHHSDANRFVGVKMRAARRRRYCGQAKFWS